ncbi:MAG: type I methionyl aminopeptidase [Candidatus Pacebacteria bacterium]|nr:type I methionyl aminopeptidase [Candidatus Paceibacterota bacterium]
MISIKTEQEIKIMKQGGAILSKIAKELSKQVKAGASTSDLNRAANALFAYYKTEPAFLNHQGFPAAICASVNDVVVHGVPSDYILKDGDVLSLDLGLKHKGFYLDMAFSKIVGGKPADDIDKRLVKTARAALDEGAKAVKPGATLGDIGFVIQNCVEKQGFSVVRNLCGHGIGKELHEDPQILNYGLTGEGEILREGMVICLEPMITRGSWRLKKSPDGFGYRTEDGSRAAHFEQTMAVSAKGCLVLTKL